MEITGPFYDKTKKHRSGKSACWFLRYSTPRLNPDGTVVVGENGRPILRRHRPYYDSKAKAEADIPSIAAQHSAAGTGNFLFDRSAAADYEAAVKIVGKVPLAEVARFWRLHHPEKPKQRLRELYAEYLKETMRRAGQQEGESDTRHVSDLRSRVGAYVESPWGERYPDTITRKEILEYVLALDLKPRTRRNHKNALSAFFGWIAEQNLIPGNPAGGIKRKLLGKEVLQEIRFLTLDQVISYLRAVERYAPELVAHEIVQLISGVRADDEMADFRAEFVLPQTREIVIPAAVAKTGKREVIDCVEDMFWQWWAQYGPAAGLLRPKNYEPRWARVRVLASVGDQAEADRLARLPIKTLLKLPLAAVELEKWPWNGRRRTFCTYHVAKYQSADKTALILRHRGSATTLHNCYRGMGVTQAQGAEYFKIMPKPVAAPIRPEVEAKGIVRIQAGRQMPEA